MNLYKGMYQNVSRKTPSSASKPTLLVPKKDYSANKKTDQMPKEKKPIVHAHIDPSKSINQLFRSSGKIDTSKSNEKEKHNTSPTVITAMRAKTSQDEKRDGNSNIVFNQRAISKGKTFSFFSHL